MQTRRVFLAASIAAGVVASSAPVSAVQSPVADESLERAVEQFYAAYGEAVNGDAAPMLALWSQEPFVSTMHAVGGAQLGWEAVQGAWEALARRVSSGSISFSPLVTHAIGNTAVVIGTETGSLIVGDQEIPFELRVSNVFTLEDGQWKAVHHHGDLLESLAELG